MSLIIPNHWIQDNYFIKHSAIHAIKLFFGDETLEKALKEAERNVFYSWETSDGREIKSKKELRKEEKSEKGS